VAGGSLMAGNQLTAGDLMSFLVSTQTIQKYVVFSFMLVRSDNW